MDNTIRFKEEIVPLFGYSSGRCCKAETSLSRFAGFLVMTLLFLSGCSAKQALNEACRNKISVTLFSKLEQSTSDDQQFEIIATLNDSAGIRSSFQTLSLPNPSIALGHMTKHDILRLCKSQSVRYIDMPKIRFPNSLK